MRKTYRLGVLIAAGVMVISPASAAAAPQIACPAEIASVEIAVTAPPSWKAHVQYPLQLASAGISVGPPEALAILRGESVNKKGQLPSTRYRFGDIEAEHGKWLNCGYGEDCAVLLSKRLDPSIRECTVRYLKQQTPGKQTIQIVCK
ncbi:STY0301 family protein [Massilia sp. TWR1-2-2]|uniref:STY0301 family protein n=1 Tax=Massilia sp. TWR1-2-2 TaxID=2804584 RepID=UPI003CF634A1